MTFTRLPFFTQQNRLPHSPSQKRRESAAQLSPRLSHPICQPIMAFVSVRLCFSLSSLCLSPPTNQKSNFPPHSSLFTPSHNFGIPNEASSVKRKWQFARRLFELSIMTSPQTFERLPARQPICMLLWRGDSTVMEPFSRVQWSGGDISGDVGNTVKMKSH